jgi:hypothetical protein
MTSQLADCSAATQLAAACALYVLVQAAVGQTWAMRALQ